MCRMLGCRTPNAVKKPRNNLYIRRRDQTHLPTRETTHVLVHLGRREDNGNSEVDAPFPVLATHGADSLKAIACVD